MADRFGSYTDYFTSVTVTNPVVASLAAVTAATAAAVQGLEIAAQAGDINSASQLIGPLVGVLGAAAAVDSTDAAVAARRSTRAKAFDVVASISNSSTAVTTDSLTQSAMLVSSITGGSGSGSGSGSASEVDDKTRVNAAAFAASLASTAVGASEVPLSSTLLTTVLNIAASTVAGSSLPSASTASSPTAPPDGTTDGDPDVSAKAQAKANAAAVTAAAASVAGTLSQGALIGALTDEPPVTFATASISVRAQRSSAAAIANASMASGNITVGLPSGWLTDVFASNGTNVSAVPANIDSSLVSYTGNVYGFANASEAADPFKAASSVVSFSLSSGGKEIKVANLSSYILITIPTGTMVTSGPGYNVTCRYWNESGQVYSTDGCYVYSVLPNATICACNHLTAFNVQAVLVPPVNKLTVQDFKNFFSWRNILKHPTPLITVASVLAVWICLATLFYFRQEDRLEEAVKEGVSVDRVRPNNCWDRWQWGFYKSTDSAIQFFVQKHHDSVIHVNPQLPWYRDPAWWSVAVKNFTLNFLLNHSYLSVWFHNPTDPYGATHRLAAMMSTLFTALSANAMFSSSNTTIEVTISIAVYTGLLCVPVSVIFPLLFRKATALIYVVHDELSPQEAAELVTTGHRLLYMTWTFLFLWTSGAILLVLVYAMQFDLNPSNTGMSATSSWLLACVISIFQDVAINGTMFLTARTFVLAFFARFLVDRNLHKKHSRLAEITPGDHYLELNPEVVLDDIDTPAVQFTRSLSVSQREDLLVGSSASVFNRVYCFFSRSDWDVA
jgi:hypothetical protein